MAKQQEGNSGRNRALLSIQIRINYYGRFDLQRRTARDTIYNSSRNENQVAPRTPRDREMQGACPANYILAWNKRGAN